MRSRALSGGKKGTLVAFSALLLAMVLRYTYYGTRYFPVLDDNNMYGIFQMMTPGDALAHYRMYTTRPVACLLDTYVWSRLWDQMEIVLLIMVLLHFFSIVLLWKVFEKNNLRTGIIAAAIFGLLPLGAEATYWIAASSRLVVGLFFASLSFYLLMLYIEQRERREKGSVFWLATFTLINLLSLGFYEQVIAFSFFGTMVLLFVNFRRLPGTARAVTFIPLCNLAAIGTYYKVFSHTGNMAVRGQLLQGDYLGHTIAVLNRIGELLFIEQWQIMKKGTLRGIEIIISDQAYIYLALALLTGICLAALAATEKFTDTKKPSPRLSADAVKFILAVILVLVPFAPFFLLSYSWIANRNAFLSLLGVALLVEAFLNLLLRGRKAAYLKGAFLGLAAFALILANTSEVSDYRSVSLTDREICWKFITAASKADPNWDKREILLFNAKPVYASLTSEHLLNCTSSDWAMMGAVQVVRGKRGIGHILPVPDGGRFSLPGERLERAMLLGIDEEKRVFPLSGRWKDSNTLVLSKEDRQTFGIVQTSADKGAVLLSFRYFQGR